jgi:hypothetical protein
MADDSEDLEANSVVSEASAESEDNRSFTTYSGRHETQRTSVLLAAVPEDLFDPAQLPEMSFTCDNTSFSGGDGACGYGDGGYGGGDGACGYGDGGYGGGDGASSSSSDETDGGTRNKRNSVARRKSGQAFFTWTLPRRPSSPFHGKASLSSQSAVNICGIKGFK